MSAGLWTWNRFFADYDYAAANMGVSGAGHTAVEFVEWFPSNPHPRTHTHTHNRTQVGSWWRQRRSR